jgi:hypothetical protein
MRRAFTRRLKVAGLERFAPFALLTTGALLGIAAWITLSPDAGRAGSSPLLVQRGMSAVQTPSPNEFPTISSAIKYLVEQVRSQNIEGATRVMPLAYNFQRATFAWQATRLASVDLNGIYPKQPFSRMYQQFGLLNKNYVLLSVELLYPGFEKKSVVILKNRAAVQQFQFQVDPARLASLSVKKISVYLNSTKVNGLQAIGVNRIAEAKVEMAGVGATRTADVLLSRYGSNWLIADVGF